MAYVVIRTGRGGPVTGVCQSSHAYKIRSVLNKPAHVTHVPTQELFELHPIEDPVVKLEKLQKTRGSRLQSQLTTRPSITCEELAVSQSRQTLSSLGQFTTTPIPDEDQGSPTISCPLCPKKFASDHGLWLHTAKAHPESVCRYVPQSFDRSKHAVGGVPTRSACKTSFKQWPGLMSHLLSGACPCPQLLEALDKQDAPAVLPEALERINKEIGAASRAKLPTIAAGKDAQELNSQCVLCGFWTPDYTKLKSHIRKVHTKEWELLHVSINKTCGGFSTHTPKGLKCPFCRQVVYNKNKHCFQCPFMFQVVLQCAAPGGA